MNFRPSPIHHLIKWNDTESTNLDDDEKNAGLNWIEIEDENEFGESRTYLSVAWWWHAVSVKKPRNLQSRCENGLLTLINYNFYYVPNNARRILILFSFVQYF